MEKSLNDIELDICLEEETKKCLKNLQNYYKKYGCDHINKLKEYLTSLCEIVTDESELNEIKKQLELLEDYS